ncbi:hypothetical protein Pan153_04680 [Gimesia panareensis]|uniref:Uncharacterized protein n=1 Tax=Gimesia panareensis TaxID=2527978 RepID=A0A518FHL7_9PLAN|nr:hypothetical protein [Gimesia panareensis]QDV15849.1 hypothetical protein Pan153_04680 [Gimesia panareensis]
MAILRSVAPWMMCIVVPLLLNSGCETMPEWDSDMMSGTRRVEKKVSRADQHRTRFLTERDPESLNWLLKHRLQSGMTRANVEKELGEEGEYQEASKWLKATGGSFRTTDDAYKWGPDKGGRSVYLMFRDDVLVNFHPEDFELD